MTCTAWTTYEDKEITSYDTLIIDSIQLMYALTTYE